MVKNGWIKLGDPGYDELFEETFREEYEYYCEKESERLDHKNEEDDIFHFNEEIYKDWYDE